MCSSGEILYISRFRSLSLILQTYTERMSELEFSESFIDEWCEEVEKFYIIEEWSEEEKKEKKIVPIVWNDQPSTPKTFRLRRVPDAPRRTKICIVYDNLESVAQKLEFE